MDKQEILGNASAELDKMTTKQLVKVAISFLIRSELASGNENSALDILDYFKSVNK